MSFSLQINPSHVIHLNANSRTNPLFNDVIPELGRVVKVAIPFLNLYRPTGLAVTVALGAVKSWQVLGDASVHFQGRQWRNLGSDCARLSLVVSSIGLSILAPTVGIVFSHGCQLASDIYTMNQSLWRGNFREAGMAALSSAHTIVYVASAVLATPELLAISLLSQAITELYYSRHELAKGNYLEAFANMAMALIRIHQAVPHVQTCHRNWFGKEMTQAELERFLAKIWGQRIRLPEDQQVDFEKMLIEENFSSYLKGLTFNIKDEDGDTPPWFDLDHLKFENVHFKKCTFDFVTAKNCTFYRTSFDLCDFKFANVYHSLFSQCRFLGSDMRDTSLHHNRFHRVNFLFNSMEGMTFNDSVMERVNFVFSNLNEANFLGVNVKHSTLLGCDLTDTILASAKKQFLISGGVPNKQTKPIVGIGWNFKDNQRYAGLEVDMLKQQPVTVMMYENTPEDVDSAALDQEVKAHLAEIESKKREDFLSIPDALLKQAHLDSQIHRLKGKAQEVLENVDALLIPGSVKDMEPEFYGAQREERTHVDADYRRTVMEFALYQEVTQRHIPTMGICRGSQMGNVYFGGTLRQHVDNQSSVLQILEVMDKGMADRIGVGLIFGWSMHHQANDQIGKGLKVFLKHGDVPKALMNEDGSLLLVQFHPELYHMLSPEMKEMSWIHGNKKFFDYFCGKAAAAFSS